MLNSRTECSACGKLYRRLLIGSHRFIKERYNEDIIFLFPLYATCSKVVYTNKRYYYYRDTIGSVTHILSDKTMHALLNQQEMEQMAIKQRIPVKMKWRTTNVGPVWNWPMRYREIMRGNGSLNKAIIPKDRFAAIFVYGEASGIYMARSGTCSHSAI